jgi:hypothetical protein
MAERPYLRYSTSEIRELFESPSDNAKLLSTLAAELECRDRPDAAVLRTATGLILGWPQYLMIIPKNRSTLPT